MKSNTACKKNQHNGSKPQTPISKTGKTFIPDQPGRTSKQKQRGTLVLNLLTYCYKKRKQKQSKTNKTRRPYLMEKEAETETRTIK